MKKIYVLFCALLATSASFAQTIPNGDMELWRSNSAGVGHPLTVQAPNTWYGADSLFIGLGQTLGLTVGIPDTLWSLQLFEESTIKHGGSHCAKLMTAVQDTITAPGVLSNAKTNISISIFPTPSISGISYSGGMPVTVKPLSVSAWVRYDPGMDTVAHTISIDSGYLLVQSLAHIGTKDTVIGTGRVTIGSTSGAWVNVTANITYPVDTTDSIGLLRITFASSGGGLTLPTDSSTMYVDDVTMTSTAEPVHIDHTGVRMLTADEFVKVYPNPGKGTIYFDGPKSAGLNCKLYAVNGQIVLTRILTGYDALDVSRLPPGSYFYTLTDDAGNTLQKGQVSVSK